MELIKDNYLYGLGHGQDWWVNIDPPKNKIKNYFEETVTVIEYIYAHKTGKFQVLYSGGQDSQYVCEVLLKLGINFEPIIIRLCGASGVIYNDFDIKYAFDFCESKNITPKVYDFNFENFVDSGKIIELAESVTCCAFEMIPTMYVASQLDGFTLLGDGEPYIRLLDNGVWAVEEKELTHSLLRFYKKFQLNGCPYLLSYTPEMMLSFLMDPVIVKLGTGQLPGKTGSNSSKAHVYNNGSNFGMEPYDYVTKKRIKQGGYEKIYDTDLMNHPNLKIFDEYKNKWNGIYLELYTNAIDRLAIHQ